MQKAAPFGSNPLLVLLDLIDSPLMLFSEAGHVVFANQAAKLMESRPALVLGSDPNVRNIAGAIAQGKIVPETTLQVEALSDRGVTKLDCRFAPKPIAGLVAMAVRVAASQATGGEPAVTEAPVDQRLSLQQIMELLRGDLLPPIQDVIEKARTAQPTESVLGLKDSLAALTERLDRMVDLVDVFGEDVLITDERVLMVDLVRSTCQELAPIVRGHRVSFVFKGDKEDLPPVYGSQKMIRRAIYECLHNAVVHARKSIDATQQVGVEIGFRASGHHLLVSVSNMGALSAAALTLHASALFKPALHEEAPKANEAPVMRIGLPLAQRILQLHGGRLRIEQDTTQELEVMLELPTGAPRRNTHHLDMLQAQIYAEDLSKLLARGRPRSAA
ncbi:MAG: ATP-binding protein [Hydrogenophaga sp.]|nr:ATP-binding protein [Hydrogenophaga sp.]